jgi:hypothetical protein
MKTTPGQIYFLKEKDYLTGEMSPYVKIGLVRDDKETDKRIKEHQTGNPRQIVDYATLSMRFVEHAETLLHYTFGEFWITGEWFKLTEEQIVRAITDCERINTEQLSIEKAFLESEELRPVLSNGKVIQPTDKDLELHGEAVRFKEELNLIISKLTICKNQILAHLGKGNGISGVLDLIHKDSSSVWDESLFKEENRELFEKYVVTASRISGSYSLQGVRPLKRLNEGLYTELNGSAVNLVPSEGIDSNLILPRDQSIEELHLKYIKLNRLKYINEWAFNLRDYQIQQRVGLNDEMEGVAKWKRAEKEKSKLDRLALFAAQPEMESKYVKEKAASVSYLVRSNRTY